jgi:hypothetical protein
VLEQQLLDALVAVLACCVDCPEAAALGEVRVCPVVERERDELVSRRLVLRLGSGGGMDRCRLDPVVPRQRVHVGASLEQKAGSVDMAEEAGEAEGVKAVRAEGVRAGRILVEELAQSIGAAEGRRLEHVEVGLAREQLVDTVAIAAVEGFEYFAHPLAQEAGEPPVLQDPAAGLALGAVVDRVLLEVDAREGSAADVARLAELVVDAVRPLVVGAALA